MPWNCWFHCLLSPPLCLDLYITAYITVNLSISFDQVTYWYLPAIFEATQSFISLHLIKFVVLANEDKSHLCEPSWLFWTITFWELCGYRLCSILSVLLHTLNYFLHTKLLESICELEAEVAQWHDFNHGGLKGQQTRCLSLHSLRTL